MPSLPPLNATAFPTAPRVRTIAHELEWGTRKLSRGRCDRPSQSALATWAALSGETPGAVWLRRNVGEPGPAFTMRYRRAISLRASGMPFQYAVGSAVFRALELAVDPSVLIPRVETEGLVEHVLIWGRGRFKEAWGIAADIGTGSGAIALSLAVEGGFDRILATDISADALATARRNVETVQARVPVDLRQGALLLPLRGLVCDVIVSNPPYLTRGECEETGPEVRDYEPVLALDGGADGLDPYRTLLADAGRHLRTGGLLALELDSRRAATVHAMALAAGWSDARVLPDPFGRDRYLLATKTEGTT